MKRLNFLLSAVPFFVLLFLSIAPVNASLQSNHIDSTIFTKTFSNGAPPCVSCHSLSKAGIYGGLLASDLSSSFQNFGKDKKALIEFLKNPPSLMAPVYKENSLSEAELQKIADFLEAADSKDVKDSKNLSAGFLFSSVFVFFAMFVSCYFLFNKKERKL